MPAHIGNVRDIVAFDVVYRLLREICDTRRAGELVGGRVTSH
jgi:lysyl-tRNA synthetase class I